MLALKLIRGLIIVIGVVIMLGLLFTLTSRPPIVTDAAAITPPPRTLETQTSTPEADSKSEQGGPHGTIMGQVIDLSTAKPGAGLEIDISGRIVRADGEGRYSLTGLEPGIYVLTLSPMEGLTPAQDSWEVFVPDQGTVNLNLDYYSQAIPTPTPTIPPPAALPPTPTAPPPQAAATSRPMPTPRPLLPLTGDEVIVWVNPGYINNEQGVAGFISIAVANAVDFGAFQATLGFDPKIIEVETVSLGDFLAGTGRSTTPLVTEVDNTTGEVSLIAFTSGDSPGPDGDGVLAVINFISKQAGLVELELTDVRLFSRLGDTIEAGVYGGVVNVSPCFGDLNYDRVIDIGDVQIVAGRLDQAFGDPNYVLEFDLNSDRVIDGLDVTMVADRLAESCP